MERGDSDESLISDEMIGYMVVFGLDFVLLAGLLWLVDLVSGAAFAAVTGLVVLVYIGWIAWRWHALRSDRSTETDPVETLKRRYAAGELSDEEFERRLDQLMDAGAERPATEREPEKLPSDRRN